MTHLKRHGLMFKVEEPQEKKKTVARALAHAVI